MRRRDYVYFGKLYQLVLEECWIDCQKPIICIFANLKILRQIVVYNQIGDSWLWFVLQRILQNQRLAHQLHKNSYNSLYLLLLPDQVPLVYLYACVCV